jgi:hypothetical protein
VSHLLDITFVLLLTMKDGSTPEHQTAGKDTRPSVSPCRGHQSWGKLKSSLPWYYQQLWTRCPPTDSILDTIRKTLIRRHGFQRQGKPWADEQQSCPRRPPIVVTYVDMPIVYRLCFNAY